MRKTCSATTALLGDSITDQAQMLLGRTGIKITVNIIFVLIITSVQSNPYLQERLHPHYHYHSFVNVVNILEIGDFVFYGKGCT